MSRVIKFKAWDAERKEMFFPSLIYVSEDKSVYCQRFTGDPYSELMQFTGKTCHGGREVYEGDILFYEEETDSGDVRYYLVVVWIDEWSMFATLHIEEYHQYTMGGSELLDEGLFWTYTLEGCPDYHYAGSIYSTPELLKQ